VGNDLEGTLPFLLERKREGCNSTFLGGKRERSWKSFLSFLIEKEKGKGKKSFSF